MRKGRDFLLKTLKRYFCSSQTHCKVLLLLLLLLLILFRYCTDTDSFSFLQMRHSSDRYSYKPTLQWNPQVEDYFIKAYGADHFSRISQSLTYVLLFLSRSSPTVFFFFHDFWVGCCFSCNGAAFGNGHGFLKIMGFLFEIYAAEVFYTKHLTRT